MSSMLFPVLMAFAAAVCFALITTPLVIRVAVLVGAVDRPGGRKTHAVPMPRLGGVAVAVSFVLAILLLRFLDPTLFSYLWISERESTVFGAALFLMLLLGVWDDIRTLGPGTKFAIQLAIATMVYASGFSITLISFPNPEGHIQLDILRYLVTTVWIIGVTNAVNLIDGLDGLASGVGIIACLTIAPIAYLNADAGTAVFALLLAGSLLGFLRYNFNPAKVFLGDSGSLVLGFALAVLSMRSSTKATTVFAILVPVLALGLPIMETLLSMLRRFLGSLYSEEQRSSSFLGKMKGMFLPDKSHIHHRLIAAGLSHRSAVLTLYLVSCLLGAGAFALTVVHNVPASLILVIVGTAAFIGIRKLQYQEMAVLRNGVLLPLYDRELINRETFQAFLDTAFIIVSFYFADVIALRRVPTHLLSKDMLIVTSSACTIQFIVLLASGIYKGSVRIVGLSEALRITKGIAFAVIATAVVFGFFIPSSAHVAPGTYVLDFYFLLTLVLGSRLSFRLLKTLSHTSGTEGKKVLLYGVGADGSMILDKILNGSIPGLVPIGFLDDDPYLEGKRIHGYTVYGGQWKLQGLLNRMHVDEILLLTDQIKPEVLRRLNEATRLHGTRLRRMQLTLDDLKSDPQPLPRTEVRAGTRLEVQYASERRR